MTRAELKSQLYSADIVAGSRPEQRLLKELKKLPQGTKIGLTTPPELHDPKIAPTLKSLEDYHTANMLAPEFWVPMVQFCRDQGLEIVFLGDMEDYQMYGELSRRATSFQKNAEKIWGTPMFRSGIDLYRGLLNPEFIRAKETYYRLITEANYYFSVVRADRAEKMLAEMNVPIVITDHYVGDDLVVNGKDIAISSYLEVGIEPRGKSQRRMEVLVSRDPMSDSNPRKQRERTLREHRAVTEWRITEGKPDFIGSFSWECRTSGLFEVYFDGNPNRHGECEARIEDVFGTSNASIRIGDGRISFLKCYDLEKSLGSAGLVEYRGISTDKGFRGSWRAGDSHGSFVMVKGDTFPQDMYFL